ncbi:MAG: transposase [Bacteroidetes bacterium]|nr:transposase [Bacteroidota bacterium]
MTHSQVWVHVLWTTNKRKPHLVEPVLKKLTDHIREYAISKSIALDSVGGAADHLHCLIALPTVYNLATIIQLLKGESSRWINQNAFLNKPFHWQAGFIACSVDPFQVLKVRKHIGDQEVFHFDNSLAYELAVFLNHSMDTSGLMSLANQN